MFGAMQAGCLCDFPGNVKDQIQPQPPVPLKKLVLSMINISTCQHQSASFFYFFFIGSMQGNASMNFQAFRGFLLLLTTSATQKA
jgi:hypothetical protein